MTPSELNTIRCNLQLTQQDLANHLEISRDTVGNWELKKIPIPRWASLAVRYLATDSVPQEGDWDFTGPVKPKFSLPVYPRVDVPGLQEIHCRAISPPPSQGKDINVRDIEGDERYTEEEQLILYAGCDNVRAVCHRRR